MRTKDIFGSFYFLKKWYTKGHHTFVKQEEPQKIFFVEERQNKSMKNKISFGILIAVISCGFVFGLVFFLVKTYPAFFSQAATVTYTGSTSSTWNTAANWSTGSVPTSADAVTISGSSATTVTIYSGQVANFSSLTIGGGTATTTVVLIGTIGTGTDITILPNGVLEQKNNVPQTISGTLTVGGMLTHTANNTTQAYVVDFTAQTITINAGGSVDVMGRGYASSAGLGSGPGGGAGDTYAGGGGHGGNGANGNYNGVGDQGGVAYCDITNVNTIGSAGGRATTGGKGGGLIRLNAAGTVTINGSILANSGAGINNTTAGGGAGGGVKIVGGTITGTPASFDISGGVPYTIFGYGGGGGGGCAQLEYTASNSITPSQITMNGGSGNGTIFKGGAGEVYIKQTTAAYGDLYSYNNVLGITNTTQIVSALTLNSLSLSKSTYYVPVGKSLVLSNSDGTPFANSAPFPNAGKLLVNGSVNLNTGSINNINLTVDGGTITNSSVLNVSAGSAAVFNNAVFSAAPSILSYGTTTISGANSAIAGVTAYSGALNIGPGSTSITSVSSTAVLTIATSTAATLTDLTINNAATISGLTSAITNLTINSNTTTLSNYASTTPLNVTHFVMNGGVLTHTKNIDTQSHVINIAATDITIGAPARVDADGKGYRGGSYIYSDSSQWAGRGPGGGYGGDYAGASGGGTHGGSGGNNWLPTYCNVNNVGTIGSGGGVGNRSAEVDSAAGGGLIILTASATTTINGVITAKGNGYPGLGNGFSGAGAGGGIKIAAASIAGTPASTITAAGGNPSNFYSSTYGYGGGGGGGGCVQIAYANSTSISTASAIGGRGNYSAQYGGDGVVTVSRLTPGSPSVLYVNDTDAALGTSNPSTLTTTTPVFSALCASPDTCTSADVQVAEDSGFTSPVWSLTNSSITSIASSTRSQNIFYNGVPLKYNTTYYWRIRFRNSYGAGAWSTESATFLIPKKLELFSLNHGGVVRGGRPVTILWKASGGGSTDAETVKIEYSSDGFAATAVTVTSSLPSAASTSTLRSYSWSVPQPTTICGAGSCSNVKIRISTNNDGNFTQVTSELPFTVTSGAGTGFSYGASFVNADFYSLSSNVVGFSGGTASLAPSSAWTRRKSLSIFNNNASTLTDFQVSVALTYDSDMQADFDDIRFTSSDGTVLSYWLETKTDGTSATFWVKVPSLAPSTYTTVYVYYGNASATSASNADATFLFADDFDSTFSSSKWTTIGTPTVSGGALTLSTGSTGIWATNYALPGSVVIESRISKPSSSYGMMGAVNSASRWAGELGYASVGFDYLYYGSTIYAEVGGFENAFSSWFSSAYRRQKIVYNDAASVIVFDNSSSVTMSSAIPTAATSDLHPSIYSQSGSLTADWIFVRKYILNDPFLNTTGAEETVSNSLGTSDGLDHTVTLPGGTLFTTASSFTASTTGAVKFQISNDNGVSWKYCLGDTPTEATNSSALANFAGDITNACLARLAPGTFGIRSYLLATTSSVPNGVDYVSVVLSNASNAAPVAPTSTAAVSASAITYNWTSGGGDETYFTVESSTDGNTFTPVATTTLSSYTFTGLATNTPYWFRVAGADGRSATSSFVTSSQVYTLAATPGTVGVTVNSDTSLTVTVNNETINGNDTALSTFRVKDTGPLTPLYLQADGTWAASTTNLSYAELGAGAGLSTSGLTPNSAHILSVAAVNPDGAASAYGPSVSVYTKAAVPPAPTVTDADRTTEKVTIIAGPNPIATEFAIYNITTNNYIAADGSNNGSTPVWQTRSTWGTITVTGLSADTAYQFGMYARSGDGSVTAMSEPSVALQTSGINNPVLTPSANALSPQSIRITWTAGEGDEARYMLESSTDGATFLLLDTVPVGTTSYTANGLSANTQYWFRVAAANDFDATSAYVAAAPVFTKATQPNAPAAITSTATTTLDILIDETTLHGNPETAATTYVVRDVREGGIYYVQHDGTWGEEPVQLSYADLGAGERFTTYGLGANTRHAISVAAVSGDGIVTDYGPAQTAYTRASVPSSFAVNISADNNITMTWEGDGAEYQVSGSVELGWTSEKQTALRNAACGTSFTFKVQSRNGDGVVTEYSSEQTVSSGPCGGWAAWRLPVAVPVVLDTPVIDPVLEKTIFEKIPDVTQPVELEFNLKVDTVVAVGETAPVVIGGEEHVVTVHSVGEDEVSITLHSEPLNAKLKLNVPQDLDSDRDGAVDVRALYTGFINGKANISFVPITPAIVEVQIPTATVIMATTTPLFSSTSTPAASTQQRPRFKFTKPLRRGSVDAEVVELQNRLKQEGFFPVAVDTARSFGAITELAVRTYQKARGLSESGMIDDPTRAVLNGEKSDVKPVSDKYFFSQTLRRGSFGNEVFELQTALLDLGFFPGKTPRGRFFGPTTENSLTKFQSNRSIFTERDAQGAFTGPKTREELNK